MTGRADDRGARWGIGTRRARLDVHRRGRRVGGPAIQRVTIVPASLSRLPLEGVTYRPLGGRPAMKVPLNLACRRDDPSAATQAFIEKVRRLA